jgi:hypothetical protein
MRLGDERIDLIAEQRHLRAEREDVLDGPSWRSKPIRISRCSPARATDALALGRPLEEQLALVDRGHRRGGRLEVGVCACGGPGDAGQDRRTRIRNRRTTADRRLRPPRRVRLLPRRSTALALARTRRLSAPSPRESTGSTMPSSVLHSDTSLATPSRWRSRSWISHATSGGSSISSGLELACGAVESRRLERLVTRLARVATAAFPSLSSRRPSAERDDRCRDVGAHGRRSAASPRPAPS